MRSNISVWSLAVIIVCGIVYAEASLSGFYVDNGIDQTVMHRMLNGDDTQEVEHELLELLGLPDRPRKKNLHPSMRKSAPKFLLDVYKRLNDESNGILSRPVRSIESDENLITSIDKEAIEESDIIMTFLNKKNHVAEVRHERGRKLWFDVSDASRDATLLMGELRIYQNPNLGKWRNETKEFAITVYAITKNDGERELLMLSTANTTSDYHGWLEMSVTEAVEKWLSDSSSNKGLYISAHAINKPEHEVRLDDIGLVNIKGNDEYQPFMVGYFKGQNIVKPTRLLRSKRNASKRRKKSEMRNPLIEHRLLENHKSCQIQTLYVSFKDLNWQDWIIAPDGYGAFYCSGECNFPLNAHMNATNHAIVQTLAHLMQPMKVPKPCCAPTKLSAISVLYFLDEANVNLKKYKNMVVKSCGCH
ncbi:hypothetical protein HA402_001057 [Bradysia odoriphaga]|nr:hypothetical protein HA402_001057 [Bradysia odoriphaga]